MKNEIKHTAHSSYRCEYHVVFAPKYRRKVIYKALRKDVGEVLRKVCNELKVEIIEAQACPEYIRNQLEEDLARDQVSIKEYMDPFTGKKNY